MGVLGGPEGQPGSADESYSWCVQKGVWEGGSNRIRRKQGHPLSDESVSQTKWV